MSSDARTPLTVTIRPLAIDDIQRHAQYLELNAPAEIAQRFRSAIMEAIERLQSMPGIGSPRHVDNPRLAGLRMYAIPGFRNHLLFYLTPNGNIEIIRLFHGAQDIYRILEEDSSN